MKKLLFVGYILASLAYIILYYHIDYKSGIANSTWGALLVYTPLLVFSIAVLWFYKKNSKPTTISDIIVSAVLLQLTSGFLYIYQIINQHLLINAVGYSNVYLYASTYLTLFLITIEQKFMSKKTFSKILNVIEIVIIAFGVITSFINCFVRIMY